MMTSFRTYRRYLEHEEGILINIQSVWEGTEKENKNGVRLIYLAHNTNNFLYKKKDNGQVDFCLHFLSENRYGF